MMKFARVIDGVVDAVALERPGHFEQESYTEEVMRDVPRLDENGNPVLDEDGEPIVDVVPEQVQRQRRVFVPDTSYIEVADDVFGGDLFDGSAFSAPPAQAPSSADVNTERDRREQSGCMVTVPGAGAIPLEGNEKSMRNLQGLAFAASLRLGQGDMSTVTVFRDAVNVDHSLVPAQVVSLWSQGAAYISALYGASWVIKALDPIPADYADDARWPANV